MAIHDALLARQGTPTSPGVIIPTPSLVFITLPQAITCTSLDISCTRHNTNYVVRAVPTGVTQPTPLVTALVATNVEPYNMEYTWPAVDIAQGWYILNASMSSMSYSTTSSPFFVHNGTDTSCFTSNSGTSSTSATPTGSQPSSSSPSTPLPSISLPQSASSSSTNLGVIIGVSIGAVALVAAVFSLWLCFYRKRNPAVSGGGSHGFRQWNGLSSTDSRGGLMGHTSKNYAAGRSGRYPHAESVGTIPVSASEEAVAIGAEKSSIHSQFGDTSPFDDRPGVALAALPVLQHQSARSKPTGVSRTYSTSSSISNEFGAPPARRPSVPDSITGRQSIDSTTYPPSSPISSNLRASSQFIPNSITSATMTHTAHMSASTSSHAGLAPDATKQANRQSFGARKRKPVPAYDPNAEPTSPSPVPPLPSSSSQAGQDQSQPDLHHKSSFGPGGIEGKPYIT
ncbi:hypothetical protein BDZ97DRAFT_1791367 [Flammula alnicola]|nr:hypothetical protein BDZ97DRAFT_1791367 [Flammula alnicola]